AHPYAQQPHLVLLFFFILRPPPTSTLFPYTTLFRSRPARGRAVTPPRRRPLGGSATGASPAREVAVRVLERVEADASFADLALEDRKSTRLNSSHDQISYAVFCLKKKKKGRDPAASS